MSTMNISLPDGLKTYVDDQVSEGSFGTASEYVRALIREDQERKQLRGLLLAGARSPAVGEFDAAYFDGLRQRISKMATQSASK
ncbi:MAG: type II toxin-antitoxin system ParD family antitoxin [Brachymonas sp.]|nr:type II toxin-antitoxin system ParD family antitoxin [Brachymonas sp.]